MGSFWTSWAWAFGRLGLVFVLGFWTSWGFGRLECFLGSLAPGRTINQGSWSTPVIQVRVHPDMRASECERSAISDRGCRGVLSVALALGVLVPLDSSTGRVLAPRACRFNTALALGRVYVRRDS
jgi:hypothetical protein